MFTKYDTLKTNELKRKAYAALSANDVILECLDEVKSSLLRTIPLTKAQDAEDRESIYQLHRAASILQEQLQSFANEHEADTMKTQQPKEGIVDE